MGKENIRESKEFINWAVNKLQAINYERYKISINVAGYEEPELKFNSWFKENHCQLVQEYAQIVDGCV